MHPNYFSVVILLLMAVFAMAASPTQKPTFKPTVKVAVPTQVSLDISFCFLYPSVVLFASHCSPLSTS